MKRTVLLVSTALATAALTTTSAAQSGNDGPGTAPPDITGVPSPDITGVPWRAHTVTVDGVTQTVPKGSRAGLEFDADERTVTGHDGCNKFGGKAVVHADRSAITFGGEYRSTLIACHSPDSVPINPSGGTYDARVTADTLTLTGPDGHVITLKR
ncbi:META domain-containing protein [Streptomyces sp. S3(2020)]|uniref:META domain-containing protein n=1 Tax=Streptomyces sp. S3(2020) TaxID=2732044 RepID=UPI001488F588|nr:META domain-containing protein [Streptomyces sp. S3(2020)]NNN35079.1 META domain-containing protein [Streptomyces sp. S3(2020)]